MPTNDFIGFASSGSANVMSQADFAAAHEQLVGVQPGPATSALANKIWRQGSNMAAALGDLMSAQGYDALDDGDISKLAKNLSMAVALTIEYNATYDFKSGSICRYNGDLYVALVDNGPGTSVKNPTDATAWAKVILTTATTSDAGYMSAADKTNLTSLLTNGDYESATVDTSHMTGDITYKRFGRLLVVSVAGKLTTTLAQYSGARIAYGLPNRDGTPGNVFPAAMVFFNDSTYYGAWLTYSYNGEILINSRDLQVPANLQFYGYIFCPITV